MLQLAFRRSVELHPTDAVNETIANSIRDLQCFGYWKGLSRVVFLADIS
jgi:hypothetical protein